MEADGTWDKMPKKEVAILKKEQEKASLATLKASKRCAAFRNAIVVVDPTIEHNAVMEARRLNIPVFAICDTSDDPEPSISRFRPTTMLPAPSNFLIAVLADAIVESKGGDHRDCLHQRSRRRSHDERCDPFRRYRERTAQSRPPSATQGTRRALSQDAS
jgi:ribosomal protein S2